MTGDKQKKLIEYLGFGKEKIKEIVSKIEREGLLNKEEVSLINAFLFFQEDLNVNEIEASKFIALLNTLNTNLDEKLIEKCIEKYEKENGVYVKLKEDFLERVRRLIDKYLKRELFEREEIELEGRKIRIPPKSKGNLVELYTISKENPQEYGYTIVEPMYYIYLYNPKDINPIIVISEERLPEGDVELRLKPFNKPLKEIRVGNSKEEWVKGWEVILRSIRQYRLKYSKEELRREILNYPNSSLPIRTPFDVTNELLKELEVKDIEFIIKKATKGFPRILKNIILPLAIRPEKIDAFLPYYGTHVLDLDRTASGKTLSVHLISDYCFDKITPSALTGFGTANEVRKGVVDGLNCSVGIDELEEDPRSEGYLFLNLLETGVARVSSGKANLVTKFYGSFKFNANADADTSEKKAEKTIRVLFKISTNLEGLARRFSLINYYNYEKSFDGDPNEVLKYRDFIIGFGKKYGKIFPILLRDKKIKNVIDHSGWDESYLKELQQIKMRAIIPEEFVRFIENLPNNSRKLYSLALKRALWDFPELLKKDIYNINWEDHRPLIIEKIKEYALFFQEITVSSLRNIAELNLLEPIVKEKLKRLPLNARRLLLLICKAVDEEVYEISDKTIEKNENLAKYYVEHIGRLYPYLSKLIDKISDRNITIIESFGLNVLSNRVIVKNPMKFKAVKEIIETEIENE